MVFSITLNLIWRTKSVYKVWRSYLYWILTGYKLHCRSTLLKFSYSILFITIEYACDGVKENYLMPYLIRLAFKVALP